MGKLSLCSWQNDFHSPSKWLRSVLQFKEHAHKTLYSGWKVHKACWHSESVYVMTVCCKTCGEVLKNLLKGLWCAWSDGTLTTLLAVSVRCRMADMCQRTVISPLGTLIVIIMASTVLVEIMTCQYDCYGCWVVWRETNGLFSSLLWYGG